MPVARSAPRAGLLALVAVLFLGGWIAWRELTSAPSHPIPFRNLTARAGHLEFLRPASHSFDTRAELVDFLSHQMPGRPLHLPRIDWARREVVLATPGPRSSSGYALRVLDVREEPGRILVRVRERTPTLGERVTPGVTYPFALIEIARSAKRVVVAWQGRQ